MLNAKTIRLKMSYLSLYPFIYFAILITFIFFKVSTNELINY